MFFTQNSLFNIVATLVILHLTLLAQCSLFFMMLLLLLLVRHCLFGISYSMLLVDVAIARQCSLFDVVVVALVAPFDVPCSMLLLLLLLAQRCCSFCCSTLLLLVRHHRSFLFFSCLTLLLFCSFILNAVYLGTYLLHCNVVVPCFLFQIGMPPPPPFFCVCGRSCPNSSSSGQTWKVRFFKSLCLLMNFFIIHVFGKFRSTMCFFVVCKNYLDILKAMLLCEAQQIQFPHLIIHMAFHFYTLHFICTIALYIFLAHYTYF